jgi:hypothetical protein
MANGLGFTTEPPAVKRVSKQTSIDMSSLPPVVETATGFLRYTGTLPTLLIFALAVAVPSVILFGDPVDWTTVMNQVTFIALPGLGALVFLATPAIGILYAAALGYHTAIETWAVEQLIEVGQNTSTIMTAPTDAEMAMSWAAAAIVVVHMLPFYFLGPRMLLRFIAAVGVVVNASIAVFLVPNWYLTLNSSAMFLLSTMLLYDGEALFGLIMKSVRTCVWITTD